MLAFFRVRVVARDNSIPDEERKAFGKNFKYYFCCA